MTAMGRGQDGNGVGVPAYAGMTMRLGVRGDGAQRAPSWALGRPNGFLPTQE